MSEWPTSGVAIEHRNLALYLASVNFVVSIVTPAEGATLTSSEVAVTWTFSPGTQSSFRVEALLAGVVVYDSGIIASATQAHTIPSGALETGNNYVIRVTVTTTDANTGQGEVNVTTAFAPSVNVTGLAVRIIGSDCTQNIEVLPVAQVSWTEVVPGGGETFVQYNVYRREAARSSSWTRIAVITTVATVSYIDAALAPRRAMEYAVTWSATDASGSLESVRQDPGEVARLDYDFIAVHRVDDRSRFLCLWAFEISESVAQEQEYVRPWGRQRPTAQIGDGQPTTLRFSAVRTSDKRARIEWARLLELVDDQRESAAVVCVRSGRSGTRYFAALAGTGRASGRGGVDLNLEIREVHFEEAVS